ncbi:MAG: hypothetical protein ACLU05_08560, partial [Anaerococcus obesiensis]
GSKTPLCGSFTRKIAQSAESSETAIFVSRKKNKKLCKINGYRRLKTVTGIKMGTFVKKNKLNNSSKWFTFGQK